MQIKIPFDSSKPVAGESSVTINKPVPEVFSYMGTHFFDNYPNWAVEVVEFEPLDGKEVFIGARAKQIRQENNAKVESVFAITDYQPCSKLMFQGVKDPYRHSYLLESTGESKSAAHLTFRFELLELDVFMRPFQKLIRAAIEDGTENTLANIKKLIDS